MLRAMPSDAAATSRPLRSSLSRALRHRNYRLYFAGQSVSLIGTWVTRVALSWLVYRLTGSALLLGLVGFAGHLPTFLLAPLAGVWVDRLNRHRVLIVTQALAMLQSALLATLVLTDTITMSGVFAVSALQGVINAFDTPTRQAFVVEMLEDRADLPNAIALNSSMVNGARLIGPSIAGILIASVGEGYCFLIDALSYLGVLGSLFAMRITPRARPRERLPVLEELRDGFRYVAGFAPIRSLLLLLALASLMGMPHTVLMPVIAAHQLAGDAHTLGFLVASSGAGALLGAFYLASRTSVLGLGRVVALASGSFGVGLMLFSRSHTLWLSLPLMLPIGMSMMVQMAASNTMLQTIVDEDKRGRVMSFYTMAFFGTIPFGSLLAGSLAERIGAADTVLVGGLACLIGSLLFARQLPELRRLARPTYVRLGILPEIAEGMRRASQTDAEP